MTLFRLGIFLCQITFAPASPVGVSLLQCDVTKVTSPLPRLVGLWGARQVGKTTLLKQILNELEILVGKTESPQNAVDGDGSDVLAEAVPDYS